MSSTWLHHPDSATRRRFGPPDRRFGRLPLLIEMQTNINKELEEKLGLRREGTEKPGTPAIWGSYDQIERALSSSHGHLAYSCGFVLRVVAHGLPTLVLDVAPVCPV